jgi:transposase
LWRIRARPECRNNWTFARILSAYTEGRRAIRHYDPVMMTALLLYGYSQGIYSSRRMARYHEERLDFLALTALNRPDHRTINKVRRRHLSVA